MTETCFPEGPGTDCCENFGWDWLARLVRVPRACHEFGHPTSICGITVCLAQCSLRAVSLFGGSARTARPPDEPAGEARRVESPLFINLLSLLTTRSTEQAVDEKRKLTAEDTVFVYQGPFKP